MDFAPEYKAYTLGPTNLGDPAGTLIFDERFDQCQIDADADFEAKRLTCFQEPVGDASTEASRRLPNFNFNIRDLATGRLLFQSYMCAAEIFGDGRIPFVLPTSHFFKRGTAAQVIYDPVDPGPDFGGSVVWLIMHGAKHFER